MKQRKVIKKYKYFTGWRSFHKCTYCKAVLDDRFMPDGVCPHCGSVGSSTGICHTDLMMARNIYCIYKFFGVMVWRKKVKTEIREAKK